MAQSEEQWKRVGRCIYCWSSIYKKGDEFKFTGPPGCNCRLEEKSEEQDDHDVMA